MLYVIAAPSGAGKTTIVQNILRENPELRFSVSATTRARRENEVEGRDYFFFSKDEFEKMIRNNELVEYEVIFNGDYYGTLKSFVDQNLRNNKNMIFDIDVKGALNIKKIYGKNAVLIFIMPPDTETLKERLKKRATETQSQINERVNRVDLEIGKANEFDYIVVNDNLPNAISEVQKIINNSDNKK